MKNINWKKVAGITIALVIVTVAGAMHRNLWGLGSGARHETADLFLQVVGVFTALTGIGVFATGAAGGSAQTGQSRNIQGGFISIRLQLAFLLAALLALLTVAAGIPLWPVYALGAIGWTGIAIRQLRLRGFVHGFTKVMAIGSACATFSVAWIGCGPTGKKVAVDVTSCAGGALPQIAGDLLVEAEAAIAGTPQQWDAEVAKLESQAPGVGICVVEALLRDLTTPPPAGTMVAPRRVALLKAKDAALERACAYLAGHNVHNQTCPAPAVGG